MFNILQDKRVDKKDVKIDYFIDNKKINTKNEKFNYSCKKDISHK